MGSAACLVGASCKATLTPLPVAVAAAVTEKRKQYKVKHASSFSIWTPPKKWRLKLNFDGSSKSKSKRSSIGGVYRDHRGKFVLGYAQRIGRATSCVAELVALKRGLQLAVENGWRDISIEGDFKSAIDAMASRGQFRAEKNLEHYTEIAAMLPRLGKTTVSHVLRKGNRVANGFANLGHKGAALRLWCDVPPDEVLQHLEQDAAKAHHHQIKRPNRKSGSSSASMWTAPKKGRLKLNFGESSKSGQPSIGGVYRDHKGKFILGYAQQISTVTSSVAALMALKRGLEIAVENGWQHIFIEGDFEHAIEAMTGRLRFRSEKDKKEYTEIAAILPQLGKTTVSHVVRKGNKVANYFAELGHKAGAQWVWRNVPPDEVLQFLEQDAEGK